MTKNELKKQNKVDLKNQYVGLAYRLNAEEKVDPENATKTQLIEAILLADSRTEETMKQTEQKQSRAEQKQTMIDRVDTWIENSNVEVKLYKNYPHVRDIKIEGKTVFQLWISANGARMCTRTNLVPEADRPQGATIIKDGFDLSIPTFTDIEAELDKYLAICQRSMNQKAEAKKAKAEAKEAEKKAKAEAKKAKKVEAEQKQ